MFSTISFASKIARIGAIFGVVGVLAGGPIIVENSLAADPGTTAPTGIGSVFADPSFDPDARPEGISIGETEVFSKLPLATNQHAQRYSAIDGAIRYWSNFALITAGVIALAATARGAYLYIVSMGDEPQADEGKKILKNVIYGIFFIVASYVIVLTLLRYLPGGGEAVDSSRMIFEAR